MLTQRYVRPPNPADDNLAARLELVQFAAKSNDFIILVRGGFYLAERWADGVAFWLQQHGQILIECPLPEALIKVTFRIVPAHDEPLQSPTLRLSQGAITLWEEKIVRPEVFSLYLSVIRGMNPIDCTALGQVLSPCDVSGKPDARKLSYAFQNLAAVELLA